MTSSGAASERPPAPADGAGAGGPEASPTDQAGEARRLGRGGIAIAAAKLYFIAIGFVQQVLLKHALGLQDYGAYGRVQNVGNIVSSPIVATSVQGVSRVVAAAAPGEQAAVARRVLGYHFLAIVPIGVAFFFAAPLITTLLNAEHLETPVRIMTGVIVLYGLYTPLVGVLNGLRRFGAQAALDATFATLRTAGLVGGAFALRSSGRGVEGAFWGFVGAALVITALAAPVLGLVRTTLRTDRPRAWQHLKFVAPLLGGQLALALLLQADNTLLGRFAADAAGALGQSEDTADTLAGAYRAAQLFCNLPYQLLLSVTFVLFPLLASAKAQGDAAGIARYVRTGVRLGLVVAGAMVSVVAGVAAPLLRVVFGADTAELAGEPMFVLALGLGAFAIFGILTTALTSLGGERESLLCTVAALGLVAGLCFLLVRGQPFGAGMLMRTALSTAAGVLAATLLAAWLVRRRAGAVVAPATLLRVLVALAAAVALGRLVVVRLPPLLALAAGLGLALVYLAVLTLLREVGRADLRLVASVVGRKRGG